MSYHTVQAEYLAGIIWRTKVIIVLAKKVKSAVRLYEHLLY